jgi:uncharacterized membrane protein HdeD (DUF308 family)
MTTSESQLRTEVRQIERQRFWIVVLGVIAVAVLGAAVLRAPVQGWIAVLILVATGLAAAGRNYRSLARRRIELLDNLASETDTEA